MYYSIIICTYNRANYLGETIDSILTNVRDYIEFELLVINNNSTDHTSMILDRYKTNPKIKCFTEERQGLSNARNRGIVESGGDVLIFLDDDIELNSNYFKQCKTLFEIDKRDIVGGKVLPFDVNIPDWLPKKFYYLASIFDLGDIAHVTSTLMGANYGMTRKVAEDVGLYNPELGRKGDNLMGGEENDYLERAKILGYEVHYSPELIVYHKINNKLNKRYLFDHAYLNGKSNAIMYKKDSKIKYTLKNIKAIMMIGAYYLFGFFNPSENQRVFFKINKLYSQGYLNILFQ